MALSVTFKDVAEDPDAYQGKTVLWAGIILEATNAKEGTLLEILQTPTDSRGKPRTTSLSKGKFLALKEDSHLNSTIYTKDRGVTIAGEVEGKMVSPVQLEEGELTYPLILIKEIRPWSRENRYSIDNARELWSPWPLPWP